MSAPIKVFKMYPLQVAIFQGERGYSAICNKNQKNKETNQYEQSSMFFPSELPVMSKLMDMAFTWIASQETSRQQGGKPEQRQQAPSPSSYQQPREPEPWDTAPGEAPVPF